MSTSQYIKLFSAGLLSMFAGAQIVHSYYKPLENFEEHVEAAKKELLAKHEKMKEKKEKEMASTGDERMDSNKTAALNGSS